MGYSLIMMIEEQTTRENQGEDTMSRQVSNTIVADVDDMAGEVQDALHAWFDECNEPVKTRTYEDAGVLTRDTGLVVEVSGKKFYITIQEA
jgi:hypothetical protein